MNFFERFQLLDRIDGLIHCKGTGTADELAERLGICRRSVFNHFKKLEDMGAEIEYDDYRKSYYYVDGKRPRLPIISKFDSGKIRGGESFFNFFLGVQDFCTPMDELCNKLINNGGQNDADGFGFSRFGY